MNKYRVGVVGATGYVGQRFVSLLAEHPWFELTTVAASPRSAGKPYGELMQKRWKIDKSFPAKFSELIVKNADDVESFSNDVDFVFCAVDMPKDEIMALEEKLAKSEIPVVSNNSANRWTEDVPMIIPEINPEHTAIIASQKKRLGTKIGFIACKPNCSIQSYVPPINALMKFEPEKIVVSTYQAISGAGKTFQDWPEMTNNLIPFIGGEEEKSEEEPLKIWGSVDDGKITKANSPVISAQCYRVAVQEGHTASVFVSFKNKPSKEEILTAWNDYQGLPQTEAFPMAPEQFLQYKEEDNRPQAKLDAETGGGMAITIGRLREDKIFDYKFACLSHNTLRGAAGGAVEMAELLCHQGYIVKK